MDDYGIWDDGDWISWDSINAFVDDDPFDEYPLDGPEDPDDKFGELNAIFRHLVRCARRYHEITGRYLSIWGELGELYVERQYGLRRHKSYAQGSDGRINNDVVEVKTISPENRNDQTMVKLSGNFNVLILVKIDENFNFESRWIERRKLSGRKNATAKVKWHSGRSKG